MWLPDYGLEQTRAKFQPTGRVQRSYGRKTDAHLEELSLELKGKKNLVIIVKG